MGKKSKKDMEVIKPKSNQPSQPEKLQEKPVHLKKTNFASDWASEPALKYVLLPSSAVLVPWVFIASIAQAGNQTGADDLGISWLATNWMFWHIAVGAAMFPLLVWGGFKWEKSMPWIVGMMIALYTTHQFEEHAWDLYGRRFPFIALLAKGFGC